ncbi:hypothetical protein HHI36_012679 [Cryptolaemus montrouzieri]|uniref:Lipase n=1 Tax=Cryptolaemus montrouzieri TaxID=559131 RepID=A0ABD2NF80_9CUCU
MMIKYIILYFILCHGVESWEEEYSEETNESLDDIVKRWGYKGFEYYEVTTADGYIITVIRLQREGAEKMVPILFTHGFSGCAKSFFLGKNESAPIFLADNDYDVWLMNSRGTDLSLRHTTLDSRRDKEFWMYSWQEIGLYDLPAAIDLVLKHNIHKKTVLIGHSEGSTVIFVTLSDRPEYNEKVSLSVHWGVSVYHEHCSSLPLFQLVCQLAPTLTNILDSLGYVIVYPNRSFSQFMSNLCKYTVFKALCVEIGQIVLFQKQSKFLETVDWPFIFTKGFCGGSVKELLHYLQIGNSGRFARFDYGSAKNLKVYNSSEPPIFHLENVSSAVAVWCGDEDVYCSQNDVDKLTSKLSNVVSTNFSGKSSLSHIDFLLVEDIHEKIYKDLLNLLKKYST